MRRALLFASLALLAGCGERYTHLAFEPLASPLPETELTRPWVGWNRVELGTAVALRAVAMDDDERLVSQPRIELTSCDPSILGVDPGPEENSFVFSGASAGETCIRVEIFGEEDDLLFAAVAPREEAF